MSILVIGSVALDSVQTPSGSVEDEPGGSALYASIAASFYTDTRVVATVGTDFPDHVLTALEDRSIDTEGVTVEEGDTFRWSGIYEDDLNKRRSIFTKLGVFEKFKPRLPASYRELPHVFLANIDPDLQMDVLDQIKHPRLVLCDTMNFWINSKRPSLQKLLGKIDILLINDEEAKEFSGETNILKAGSWLLEKGPHSVVIKKGEHGASLFGSSEFFSLPSYPVYEVIDPTGAGDTFAGAMIGFLSRFEKPGFEELKQSLVAGSVFASFCIEGFGARRLLSLKKEEISARTKEFLEMFRISRGGLTW